MKEIKSALEELRKLGIDVEVVHHSSYDGDKDEYKEWNEYNLYNKSPLVCETLTESAFRLWYEGFKCGRTFVF